MNGNVLNSMSVYNNKMQKYNIFSNNALSCYENSNFNSFGFPAAMPLCTRTFPADNEEQPWKGFRKPSGQLAIPETVTPDRSRGRHADHEDDDTTIYTVTAIRYFAFAGCDRITQLTLPSTIRDIGEGAFAGCKRIEYIVSQSQEPPRLDESSFDQVDLDIPVRVPTGTYEQYHQAVGWRQFSEITEY